VRVEGKGCRREIKAEGTSEFGRNGWEVVLCTPSVLVEKGNINWWIVQKSRKSLRPTSLGLQILEITSQYVVV
jgi:hypothetical protein